MTSLTERYLAATLRSVPVARREEIATELRASIDDMIEARTADGRDTATAEREVLTELGDPAQLAARYADRRLYLIGPTHFLAWERVLKRWLSFLPATVGTIVGLIEAIDGNAGGAIGEGVTSALWTAVQVTFWVTLVFAVLERTNVTPNLPEWTVDRLPEDREDRQIPLTDTGASIGWLVLVIAYLPWQHYRSFVSDGEGGDVPILDPALWSFWLPYLIAVLVACIGFEIVKYRVGRWTWPLVAGKVLLDLAFAVPLVWLLLTDRLINPDLVERLRWLGEGDNLTTVATVVAVGTVLVILWDIVESVVKAYRSRT
ncbi:permease prefix domain 1-containing protein [Micromonospora sp. NPDC023956]|uniref:permease prefix domain 1-containing protein n=1 Tax=Micromonospora sp. NPDC023956 TaxID=3155722 RepID=UPI0033CB21BA